MLKIIIIVNLKAGNGKAEKRWENFKKKISIPFEEQITLYPGHAREIAEQYAKEAEEHAEEILIVAFGGDGTVHEVISGVACFGYVRIAAIGAGSGNDFMKGFPSFKNAKELEKYVHNPIGDEWMDLGHVSSEVGQYVFVNNTGMGFDADIAHAVNKSSMKNMFNTFGIGKLTYAFFVIKTLFTFKRFNLTVETDSHTERIENVWFATVSNQPYFGGGMKISPQSKPDDGLVELTIVHNISRLMMLLLFASVFFGAHTKLKAVKQTIAKSFILSTDAVLYRHADGEYAGMTVPNKKVTYTVKPARWKHANNRQHNQTNSITSDQQEKQKLERGSS